MKKYIGKEIFLRGIKGFILYMILGYGMVYKVIGVEIVYRVTFYVFVKVNKESEFE